MVLIMGYAAGIAFITNTQSIWIFILGILCFLLVNFVLWLETRTVRWHLKVYKRKIYEVLRNLNKFEDPRGSHNASKVESEIADFYGNIGRQIKKSFQIEKQFTQNASHELQTPITVIKTSLESLLQSPNLQENDYKDIEIILSNTNKLSRINQALVLLSRIRSYYNDNVESVNINDVLLNCQQDYEERMEHKGIKLTNQIEQELHFEMNRTLAEIMISNLLTNAIKYNLPNGNITCTIKDNKLRISNTGKPLTKNPEQLFDRFARDNDNPESLGLGLSIVKMITEYSGIVVDYFHKEGLHELVLRKK